jgi:hypothetical protein
MALRDRHHNLPAAAVASSGHACGPWTGTRSGGEAMSRNKILLLGLILALLAGGVFLQAKYQPHPELNYNPKHGVPSTDRTIR